MKELISLDEMFENIKSKNETFRRSVEASEKTIDIINKIVKTREGLGVTQRELAKKCGIKQPALARIETFKVVPKINTLIKITQALGMSLEMFTAEERNLTITLLSRSQFEIKAGFYNYVGDVYGN